MITVIVGAVVLSVVTAVHEVGHWIAIRAKQGRVLRVQIGWGFPLWHRRREPEVVVAVLPFGGRIDYEGASSGTAQVVVAMSGSVANLVFAVMGFGVVGGLAGSDGTPDGGTGGDPVGYALRGAGGWFWTVPGAMRDLVHTGMALELNRSIHEVVAVLASADPISVLYVASALSAVWAAINLIPIPVVRTDGWLALAAVWRAVFSDGPGAPRQPRS